MSEFNEHSNPLPHGQGDPNWQRLFDEASEMPPLRVWDAIERDLDRKDDERVIIVPFWGRSSTWAWSAAAAIALLLLGWWSFRTPMNNSATGPVSVASKQSPSETTNDVASRQPNGSEVLIRKPTKKSDAITAENPDRLVLASPPVNQPSSSLTTRTSERLATKTPTLPPPGSTNQEQSASARPKPETQLKIASDLLRESPLNSANQTNTSKTEQDRKSLPDGAIAGVSPPQPEPVSLKPATTDGQATEPVNPAVTSPDAAIEATLATLASRPAQFPTMYGTQRIVWFRPTTTIDAPVETASQKVKAEHWASVSVMPSSFNPSIGLQQATATYGNVFAQSINAYAANPALKSQADLSMAYQLSGGIQLGNRWSVETGVGYLEARSTVNSPVQTIISAMAPNGRLSNLYADALNNSRVSDKQNSFVSSPPGNAPVGKPGSPSAADPLMNTNVYDIGRSQALSNDYTFVQVPVQLGYQIRPRKRLGFTVLGGLLTNLFVRNTVNDQLSITNTDMVYRPVTLSASTGLRFRYRPTRRWSASMAGIFQQALQRGTRAGADLTTRPQTMGVSVGLDYHF